MSPSERRDIVTTQTSPTQLPPSPAIFQISLTVTRLGMTTSNAVFFA